MSRKIEKKLRDAANKEHKKILEANKPFFDEVLMPRFEEKILISAEEKRKRSFSYSRFGLIAAPLALVVLILSVIWLSLADKNYFGPFKTAPSDLKTVNQYLIKTQLTGDFETVILTSDQKNKAMYFTISQAVTSDESQIESNIELIIERSLTFDFEKTDYKKRLIFLGYEIKFNESVIQNTFEDMPVLELTIEAYFDTGKERYFITYSEITINESSSFENYLTSLVQKNNI